MSRARTRAACGVKFMSLPESVVLRSGRLSDMPVCSEYAVPGRRSEPWQSVAGWTRSRLQLLAFVE
eukprot:788575-Lingulodinium_polyedra.AAC.1